MIISIDLDDVLADSLTNFIEFYNDKYDPTLKYEDFTRFTLHDIKGIPKQEEVKILKDYDESGYPDKITPMKGAPEAILKLSSDHELIVVTARLEDKEELTREWLDKFFKHIKDVHFIRKEYHRESKQRQKYVKK